MSYLYEIYCNTEEKYVSAWSNVPLTTCPNDSSHSVNLDSVYIDQAARANLPVITNQTIIGIAYDTLGSFFFQGTDYFSIDKVPVKYLKISAYVDLGNYNLRLIDSSNTVLYESAALTNTTPSTITIDFDTLTLPSSEDVFRLQAKTSAGTVTVQTATTYHAYTPDS